MILANCDCDGCTLARKQAAEKAKETPNSRILTRETVLRWDPCYTYRSRFLDRFPESVEVTVKLAVSQANDWDWFWAAENLLKSTTTFDELSDAAYKIYEAAMRPFRDLEEARAQEIVGEYRRIDRTQGWREASKFWDTAMNVVVAARAAADAAAGAVYKQAQAKAWAECYIAEGTDNEN